jgi:hypothetical protein
VRPWLHGEGLSYQLDYALDELDTISRLVPGVEGGGAYLGRLAGADEREQRAALHLVEQFSLGPGTTA